jgi:thiol-disulfide isomerase/thioredoxin
VEFALPDVTGRLVRLTDLRGRPVLINFWATWCYPCREEMPSLHALYTAYREQGFIVVAVATDTGGRDTVAPFVQQYGLTFPVVLDPHNTLGERLQVAGLPTSYVLDRQGRIVSVEVGKRQWDRQEFRRLLERLLAESAASG